MFFFISPLGYLRFLFASPKDSPTKSVPGNMSTNSCSCDCDIRCAIPTVIFCDNVRWGKVELDAKEAAALGKCQLTWIVWISWMLWWQESRKKRRPKSVSQGEMGKKAI